MNESHETQFQQRHIGPGSQQTQEMLAELGLNDLEDIIALAVPGNILNPRGASAAPPGSQALSESEMLERLGKIAASNQIFTSMIGMGYYDTLLPAVIKRNVLENPAWYTAYTPYQAEVSQGRLEALLNFQQMIIDLTGMEVSNASLLDEATAAAEAIAMSRRLSSSGSNAVFVDQNCLPQTIAVIKTRARPLGYRVIVADPYCDDLQQHDFFALVLQYPGSDGEIKDIAKSTAIAHSKSALVTVAADLLALVLLKPPGDFGVDIAIGSAQRFGVPMGYGGPHAAYFAGKNEHIRSIPGRIIGVSKDSHGQPALRMALQTREQHIRRDKATSNICTAEVLLAVIAGFYAAYHGEEGLRAIANRVHRLTRILALGIEKLGYKVLNECYFDTLVIHAPGQASHLLDKAAEARINLRWIDADHIGLSLDETTTKQNLIAVWQVFASGADLPDIDALAEHLSECIPESFKRQDAILQHPAFKLYRSETEMMRYMSKLARRDIALDRSMIPLGSCTMKLNAAAEMQTLSYPELNALHPFAPLDQTQGYKTLFDALQDQLCALTGFDAFSFQPNAGSQGEFTGLLVIRKYHEANGQAHRNVCLIPASAHGTNPASAHMAGLEIIVVACDEKGNVSLDDLRAKAAEHQANLAALMITYPSTHGVFESAFIEICELIHQHGGQVYLDGANFNALVGLSLPGQIGADVAHLNLHKTFCIPHGGGGPGVGPIGVRRHLAAFLPDHPVVESVSSFKTEHETIGAVSAAPFGSASLYAISWGYLSMMGFEGLRRATLTAILNANYIAKRLEPHYPILYTNEKGWVAHECIIDCRAFKKSCGVTVEDIAKRLIDYGFHAPTVSFPVAETLMIEPTESENKTEIDRFCDALISIRQEIRDIETGQSDASLLHNAPHTHRLLLEEWNLPYSRQKAFFPNSLQHEDKYWPPVGRIDNVYGDRHVFCSCIE